MDAWPTPSPAHPCSCPFVRPRYPITGHGLLPPRLTFLRRRGDIGRTTMNTETRDWPVFEICCATVPLSRLTSRRMELACNLMMMLTLIGFVGGEVGNGGIPVSIVFERIIWSSMEIYTIEIIEIRLCFSFLYKFEGWTCKRKFRGENIIVQEM